ncbi:PH domain-containing protein DDB_G0267786-like isoform X2 [Corticium candelabrum]|uniref:PH domain-containing protein DDB_G0267786-like isoform X2 n=1 Tax=Corticium candelabrum TaxID=121492 RepID=UPI002E25E6E2|nr:PH domain-containing protein DDB_G0267786-like isoform X2 [Corticium candelabrum]
MGIGPFASPISDDQLNDIKSLIETVLTTFTVQYSKAYAVALVKHIEEELKKEKPDEWKLLERPVQKDSNTRPLKTGYLVKQGAIRKNWLRRFFVVRPDYKVDYYETKETYDAGGKPKGTVAACGYGVSTNVAKDLLARAQDVAAKLGMEAGDISPVKSYPEFCWEVHHIRRRCWFIHATSKNEKEEWTRMFKLCCRRCDGYNNKDPVHIAAFQLATRKTRHELGHYRYWVYGGTEEQVLGDLIVDDLECTLLKDIYSKIKGPRDVRIAIRSKVLQVIDSLVMAAVTPAYKAMEAAVKVIRGRIEEVIRSKIEPLFKAKQEIKEKIQSAILETINPTLAEKVSPRLAGIIEILISPMTEAFQETRVVFDDQMTLLARTVKEKNGFGESLTSYFHDLDCTPRTSAMYDAFKKVKVMKDPLWALHQFFNDITPSPLIHEAKETLSKILDMAIYTFEKLLEEEVTAQPSILSDGVAAEGAVQQLKDSVQQTLIQRQSPTTEIQ